MVVEDLNAVEERSVEVDKVEISQVEHHTKENENGSIDDGVREAASGNGEHEVVELLKEEQVQSQDIIGENGDTSMEGEVDSVDRSSSAEISQEGDLIQEATNAVEEVFYGPPATVKDGVSSEETGVLDDDAPQSDGPACSETTEGLVLHAGSESQNNAQLAKDQNGPLIETAEDSVPISEEVDSIQEEMISTGKVDDSVSTTNAGEHCEETAPVIMETPEKEATHDSNESLSDLAIDENEILLHEGTHEDARSLVEDEIVDVASKVSASEQGAETDTKDQRAVMAANQNELLGAEHKPQESQADAILEDSLTAKEGLEEAGEVIERGSEDKVDDVVNDETKDNASKYDAVTTIDAESVTSEAIAPHEEGGVENLEASKDAVEGVKTAEDSDSVTIAARESNDAEGSKEVPLSVAATEDSEAANNSVTAAQVDQSTEHGVVNSDGGLERLQQNLEATTTFEESEPTEKNNFEEARETDGLKSSEVEPSTGNVVEEGTLVPEVELDDAETQTRSVENLEDVEFHTTDAETPEKVEEQNFEHKVEGEGNNAGSDLDVSSEVSATIVDAVENSERVDLLSEPAVDLESVKNLETLNNEGALEDGGEDTVISHEVPNTAEEPDSEAPASIVHISQDGEIEQLEQQNTDPEVERAVENAADEAKDAANDQESVSIEETTTTYGGTLAVSEQLQGITADIDDKDGGDNIPLEVFEEQNVGDAETQTSIAEDLKDGKLHTVPVASVETPEKLEEHNIQQKIEEESKDEESNLDVPPEISAAVGEPIVADAEAQVLEAFKDAEMTQVEQTSEQKMDTASEFDEETKDSKSMELYGEPAADLESVKNLEELNAEHTADRVLEDHDEPVANGHEVSGTVEVPGVTDSEAPISIDNDSTDGKSPVIQDVKTENLEQENTDPEVDRALDNATDEAKAAANEESVSIEETTTADGGILAVSEHLQGITADVDGKVVEPENTDGGDNISSEVSVNFEEQNLGDAETQPSIIEDFKDEKLHTVPATYVETPENLEEHSIEQKIEDEANDAESNLDVPPEASVTIGEPIVADADAQILEAFKDAELAQVEQNSENTASEIGEETKGDSVMVEELSIADAEDPTSIIEDSKSVDLHKEPAADLESVDELNNEHTADRALEDDNERTDIGQEVSGTVEEPDFSDSQETERIDKDSKDGKLHISPDVETEHLDGEKAASEQITADVDEKAFELENKDGGVIEEKVEGDHLSVEDTVIIARDTDAVLQETATGIGSESLDGVVETLSSSDNNDEVADITSVLPDDAETFGVAQQKSQETTIQAPEKGVDKDEMVEVFPVQNPNEVDSIVVGKEADENEGAPPVNVEQPSSRATKEQPVELQGTNEDDAANTVSVCDGLAVDEEIMATSNNNVNNVAESPENEDEREINIQVPAMDERSSIIDAQVTREELQSPVGSEVEQNEAEEQLPPEVAEVTLRNEDEEENKSEIKDEPAVEAEIAEAKVEIEGITPEEPAETEVQMSNNEDGVENEAEDSSEVNDAMNELKGTLDGVFEAEAEHDAPESWDDSSNEPEKVEAAATGKSEEVQELQGHTEASDKAATLDESAVDNLPDDSSRAPEGNSDVPDIADRALAIEGESDSISGNNSENAEKISAEAGDVADVVYNGLVTEVPQDSVIAEGKATMEKVKESGDEKQDAELEDELKAPPQIVQHLQEKAAPADDKEDESISVDNAGSKEGVPIETGPMDSRTEQTLQEIDDSKDEVPSTCGLGVVAAEQLVGDQPEEEKAGSGTAEVEHEKITVIEAGDNTTRVIEESEISSEPNGVTIGGSFGRETEGGSKISDESEEEIGIVSTGEEPVNQGIASENLEKAAVEESEQDTKGAEELLAVAAEASVPCAIAEAIDDYNGDEKSLLERALVKVEAGNESEEQRNKHEDVETGKTEEKHEGRESGKTEKENTDNLGTQPETGEPVEQAKVFTTANSIATTLKSIIAALSTKPSKKKRQRLRKELVKTQELEGQ